MSQKKKPLNQPVWINLQILKDQSLNQLLLLKLVIIRRIFLIKTSMKKFGDSSMLTRTLFHGNKEEFFNHIQQTDGSIHQADMKLQRVVRLLLKNQTRRRILEIRTLMKRFGDSSMQIKTLNHGKAEE